MSAINQTRVQIRMSEDEKASLMMAARRSGFKTLSEFMRVSAHEKAKRAQKEFPEDSSYKGYKTPTEPTILSDTDSEAFFNRLLNPQNPNPLLKALFSKDNDEILRSLSKYGEVLKQLEAQQAPLSPLVQPQTENRACAASVVLPQHNIEKQQESEQEAQPELKKQKSAGQA